MISISCPLAATLGRRLFATRCRLRSLPACERQVGPDSPASRLACTVRLLERPMSGRRHDGHPASLGAPQSFFLNQCIAWEPGRSALAISNGTPASRRLRSKRRTISVLPSKLKCFAPIASSTLRLSCSGIPGGHRPLHGADGAIHSMRPVKFAMRFPCSVWLIAAASASSSSRIGH